MGNMESKTFISTHIRRHTNLVEKYVVFRVSLRFCEPASSRDRHRRFLEGNLRAFRLKRLNFVARSPVPFVLAIVVSERSFRVAGRLRCPALSVLFWLEKSVPFWSVRSSRNSGNRANDVEDATRLTPQPAFGRSALKTSLTFCVKRGLLAVVRLRALQRSDKEGVVVKRQSRKFPSQARQAVFHIVRLPNQPC